MNHPTEDQLLLLAYGELSDEQAIEIESHIAACSGCADRLAQLERGRVALEVALPARRRSAIVWATVPLAAAAVIAALLLIRTVPSPDAARGWHPTTVWSATAGYVAGGDAMVDIDAQLTRLEQERSYAVPN
jgi:Putative zinc-finger